MRAVLDAFWRAAADLPAAARVWMSLLPLLAIAALGAECWRLPEELPPAEPIAATLRSAAGLAGVWRWLDSVHATWLQAWVAPFLLALIAVPRGGDSVLLMVSVFMTPALCRWWPAPLSGPGARGRELVSGQPGLVARLDRAGAGGAGRLGSAVADPAAGAGAAAADLGLAHLPRDGLRRAGRARQRGASAGTAAPAPLQAAAAWASSAATWVPRRAWCGPRGRLRGGVRGPGAGGDLDLHLVFAFSCALVRCITAWRR